MPSNSKKLGCKIQLTANKVQFPKFVSYNNAIMKKIILSISILVLSTSILFAQKFNKKMLTVSLDQYAKETIIPAFAIVGLEKSGNEFYYTHGNAIWSENTALSSNNIYRIFSMTKAIATVGVMQLVEQKKVTLDESLEKWLPEMLAIPVLHDDGSLQKAKTGITLRQLLTHTAGFAYSFNNQKLADFKKPADWPHKDYPRVFESGTRFYYGTSIDWVGRLIEKISGMDLENYLKKNVTGPLGMTRTFFVVPDSLQNQIVSIGALVKGATPKINELPNDRIQKIKPTSYNAGGGLFSTPHDYAQFIKMILNGGSYRGTMILKPETIDMMFQNQMGELFTEPLDNVKGQSIVDTQSNWGARDKWGLAWAIDQEGRAGVRSPGAAYWSGAANTFYSIDRKKGKAVITFTNFWPFGNKYATDLHYRAEELIYK